MRSAQTWATDLAEAHPQVRGVASFGSYVRGDEGVGSDLDLFIVVAEDTARTGRRSLAWGVERLPVPAEVVVYSEDEWRKAAESHRRFYRTIAREAIWLWRGPDFRG